MKNLVIAIVVLFGTASANAQVNVSTSQKKVVKGTTTNAASETKFVYPPGMTAQPIPTKKNDDGNTYVLVTNESNPMISEYKIDIYRGHKKLSKATALIKFALTSPDKQQISVGTYRFSDKDPSDRQNFKFKGDVNVGGVLMPITDGWFQLNAFKKRIVITYNLTLKNGVKATGQYDTEYATDDRSESKPPENITIRQQ